MTSLPNVGLAIGLLCFAWIYLEFVLGHPFIPSIYHARDITYAESILRRQYVWFGPSLSGGGQAPGAFYYWLLAIPISITGSWQATSDFCLGLGGLASVLVYACLQRRYSVLAGVLGYVFFLNSFVIQRVIFEFWNPSYLPLLFSIILFFFFGGAPRRMATIVSGAILIGLALQIHLTALVFVIAAVVALLSESNLRGSVRAGRTLTFLVFAALPLLPYFFWGLPHVPRSPTHETWVSGVLAFLRRPQELMRNANIGSMLSENFVEWARAISLGDPFFVPLLFIVPWRWSVLIRDRFLLVAFCVSAMLLPWFIADPNMVRYVLPFFLLFVYASALTCGHIFLESNRIFAAWVGGTLAFNCVRFFTLVANHGFAMMNRFWSFPFAALAFAGTVLAIMISQKVGRPFKITCLIAISVFNAVPSSAVQSVYTGDGISRWDPLPLAVLLRAIVSDTRWSYLEFSQRTELVGIPPWLDLSLMYRDAEMAVSLSPTKPPGYDGAIVSYRNSGPLFSLRNGQVNIPDLLFWAKNLPIEFSNAIIDRSIQCVVGRDTGDFQVCYYRFKSKPHPVTWGNVGYSYQKRPPPSAPALGYSGVIENDSHSATAFLNPCESGEADCSISFHMVIENRHTLHISISGDPVGVPQEGANPAWAASLQGVKVEIDCAGEWKIVQIASHLGLEDLRQTFLAPFDRYLPLDCESPLALAISGEGSGIFNSFTHRDLPRFRIEWNRGR